MTIITTDGGRHHGTRNGDDDRQGLRHAGHQNQDRAGGDAHPARGHAGKLDHGRADRIGSVRSAAAQAGQQIAGALRGDAALHGAKVHRAKVRGGRAIPRHPLGGDGDADGSCDRHQRD